MKKKFPDFATLTIAYNEENLIGGMLEGIQDIDNYVIISKPFHIEHTTFDRTERIAKKLGAKVIKKDFDTQLEERNWGMDYLEQLGYKYILVLDCDEYYLKSDIPKIIDYVRNTLAEAYKSANTDKMYWKNEKWHFVHGGFFICLRSDIRFNGNDRSLKVKNIIGLPNTISMHHFSYSRTNEEILVKISTRDFSKNVRENWYKNVWLKWTPEMVNLGPVSPEAFPRALPTVDIPEEILLRYKKNYE